MRRCFGFHEEITSLTQLQHQISEQDQELGKSKFKRLNESRDLSTIRFDDKEKLQSISSSFTVSENDVVNRDNVENIGFSIQQKIV